MKLTEGDYVAILQPSKVRGWRISAIIIIGILCLFSRYTLVVGIALICLGIIAVVLPHLVPFGARSNFKGHRYLHQKLTYGVMEDGLWIRGKDLDARASWHLLVTWRVLGDWLILSPSGIPQIYLPISKMKESSVYDKILDLARKHGKEFGK
ncbi:MAG: hypothetical protein P9M00_11045 [Candidatus Tritonobacter lacicola]|nr:hypothetical protein [Candidatus Tritonobacter lacicola]